MKKLYLNWSSGKDASLALYYLQKDGRHEVVKLLTTINAHYDRVSMHGLRKELLEAQAKAIGLPLELLALPQNPTMEEYSQLMGNKLNQLKAEGLTTTAFGDIFLEDLRAYREEQLEALGIEAIFPLWKRDTKELMNELLSLGFKVVVVCANAQFFDENFVGQILTPELVAQMPDNVDVCGENGEFHTFCFDGPIFDYPVDYTIGEKVYRAYPSPSAEGEEIGFWYCDILTPSKE